MVFHFERAPRLFREAARMEPMKLVGEPVVLATATMPTLPPAEAGDSTSEFKLVRVFGIISGGLLALLVAAVAAHLIVMPSETLAFVGTAVTTVNGLVVSVYAIARSSRKKGTPSGAEG